MKIESLYKTGEFPLEGDIVRITSDIKTYSKVLKDFSLNSHTNIYEFNHLCQNNCRASKISHGYVTAENISVKDLIILVECRGRSLWLPAFVIEKIDEDK